MARRGRSERASSIIWPGFVDAMTALLLVLMFVLSIFMIVQYILREEITDRDNSLQQLTAELGFLASELSASEARESAIRAELQTLETLLADERDRADELAEALSAERLEAERLTDDLAGRIAELAALTRSFSSAQSRLSELEALAASLEAERDSLLAEGAEAGADAQAEADARAELEAERLRLEGERDALQDEVARVRAALARAEERFEESELTLQERIAALELAVQERAAEAERALLLLAAADARAEDLTEEVEDAAAEMSRQELLAAFARAALAGQQDVADQNRRAIALLNQQIASLRAQVASLRDLLDAAEALDEERQITIENLGAQLNTALAQQVDALREVRSEFFAALREILGGRDDIRIVGDRFVFQSEVLFDSGSADLGPQGERNLSIFAQALREIIAEIPGDVDWILRVDGHTDVVPLGVSSEFENNWELSTARALSVVTYLIDEEGIAPERLAAAGFGEFRPLDPADTREAYARNRRIELKLTTR